MLQKKECKYNTDAHFKNKVNRVLDMFGHKPTNSKEERVNFQCKSINSMLLPNLDSDSMNSHGDTKVRDVGNYIFWEDGLCKSVLNVPQKKPRKPENSKVESSASDYIDLVLLTKI